MYYMKKMFFILCIAISSLVLSQKNHQDSHAIPRYDDITDLIKNIDPNPDYKNWAWVFYDFKKSKILFQRGKKKLQPERKESDFYGFYPCLPGGCYHYFYVVNKNNVPEYISEWSGLIRFFGKINTIQEALILATLSGYVVDKEFKEGNIYQEFKDKFILHLSEVSYSPYKKEAFIIEVKKNGELTATSNGVYYTDPNMRIDI